MYETVIRPILFALSKDDPEEAHELAIRAGKAAQRYPALLNLIRWWYELKLDRTATVAGIKFPNRIGLAAGLDKQGELLPLWQAIGFGFVEVGSVLPRPQAGNPRPRLYRVPHQEALFNRMGFNSAGVESVVQNLAHARTSVTIPIGGSLGKQKETPIEEASKDYVEVLIKIAPYVDYLVVNVSSPNTLNLRTLQARDYLEQLVLTVRAAELERARKAGEKPKSVFCKLAPDLTDAELDQSLEALAHAHADGINLGNTTVKKLPNMTDAERAKLGEIGGFSGAPLFIRTYQMVSFVRARTSIPIIACGGIRDARDVRALCEEGADLVQVLTSPVYHGPAVVKKLKSVPWHQ